MPEDAVLSPLSTAPAAEEQARLTGLKASLEERERQLAEAYRIARLGTWRWVVATGKVTWSEEVYRTFSKDPGKPPPPYEEIIALYAPASRRLVEAALDRCRREGEPYHLDMELCLPGGEARWVSSRGQVAARGADGQVTELSGTIQDITERKLVELQLRERERELSEAHRIGRLGTFRWIKATNQVLWSEEVFRAFGVDPSLPPPRGEQTAALMTPASWEATSKATYAALENGEAYALDLELVDRDGGGPRWVTVRGEGLRDADGSVRELAGTVQDITERKRAEADLRERERELLDMQRIAATGSWKWVAATGKKTWSEGMYRLFERDLTLPVPEDDEAGTMFAPGQWAQVLASFGRMAEGQDRFMMECELRLPSGTVRWVMLQAEAVRGADGGFLEIRGTMRDMTERKRQVDELQRSEARYRSLVKASSDIVWISGPNGEQEGDIPEWRAFTGQTEEEVKGFRSLEAVHPEDLEPMLEAWRKAVETGGMFEARHRLRRHDGVYRVFESRAVPSKDSEGRVYEWVGMHTDITEKVEAEAALRDREKRFRELAESLPELLWVSEPDGTVSYLNESFLRYVGLEREEVMGDAMLSIVHPEDAERAQQMWQRSLATGQAYAMEVRLRRHDGEYRTFLARATAVRNEQGAIERWLGTATDMHDQKIAEEAVRRTEKLAVTGRLAASMAHEINNPLAAVTNSLYLALMDRGLSQETRQYLEQAEQELARVAAVTTQTLRFHRQSWGPGLTDVCELLDSALGLFAGRFASKKIAVQREYAQCPRLHCSADEVRQVLANLLSNAQDATPVGGRLRLRVREACSPVTRARGLRVTVADTGEGIPERLRHAITEPFMTTKEATGTGLGLWVSEGIVKKHKGSMSWRSRTEVGRSGTVFALFFPFDGMEGGAVAGGRVN
jgi:PAS domain S-box-containing protein